VAQAVGSSSNGWKTLTVRFRSERLRDGVGSSSLSRGSGRMPLSQASRTTRVSWARWVDESVGRVGRPRAVASWETWRTGSTTPSTETEGTIGLPASSQRRVPSAPSRMLTDSQVSADLPRNSRAAAQLAQAGCQKSRISGMSRPACSVDDCDHFDSGLEPARARPLDDHVWRVTRGEPRAHESTILPEFEMSVGGSASRPADS